MPQLDASTYLPQLFWLAISFIVLYLIMWKVVMPRIASVLQDRQERIDDDLEKAGKLRNDAASVLQVYEKTVADGRAQAQAILREAADRAAAEAAERQAQLAEGLSKRAEEAEARIDAAREQALSNIRSVAAEAAQAATQRLGGASVSPDEAERAVASVLSESR
jgi:F-type H+-transporting ATPase subunit b